MRRVEAAGSWRLEAGSPATAWGLEAGAWLRNAVVAGDTSNLQSSLRLRMCPSSLQPLASSRGAVQ